MPPALKQEKAEADRLSVISYDIEGLEHDTIIILI